MKHTNHIFTDSNPAGEIRADFLRDCFAGHTGVVRGRLITAPWQQLGRWFDARLRGSTPRRSIKHPVCPAKQSQTSPQALGQRESARRRGRTRYSSRKGRIRKVSGQYVTPVICLYGLNGETAPSGPRDASGIAAAGIKPGPRAQNSHNGGCSVPPPKPLLAMQE